MKGGDPALAGQDTPAGDFEILMAILRDGRLPVREETANPLPQEAPQDETDASAETDSAPEETVSEEGFTVDVPKGKRTDSALPEMPDQPEEVAASDQPEADPVQENLSSGSMLSSVFRAVMRTDEGTSSTRGVAPETDKTKDVAKTVILAQPEPAPEAEQNRPEVEVGLDGEDSDLAAAILDSAPLPEYPSAGPVPADGVPVDDGTVLIDVSEPLPQAVVAAPGDGAPQETFPQIPASPRDTASQSVAPTRSETVRYTAPDRASSGNRIQAPDKVASPAAGSVQGAALQQAQPDITVLNQDGDNVHVSPVRGNAGSADDSARLVVFREPAAPAPVRTAATPADIMMAPAAPSAAPEISAQIADPEESPDIVAEQASPARPQDSAPHRGAAAAALRVETDRTPADRAPADRQVASSDPAIPDTAPSDVPDVSAATPDVTRFEEMVRTVQEPQARMRSPVARAAADQIAAALNGADPDQEKLVIRLKPQGMGIIEIEFAKDASGKTEVTMRVQNPLVLEALRSERGAIADILGPQARNDALNLETFTNPGKQERGGDQSRSGQGGQGRGGQDEQAQPADRPRETVLGATDILI